MNKLVIATLGGILLLAGCSRPVHSVDWYEHHPRTMDAVNTKCGNEPGQGINDQNCLNAQQAVVNHLMQGATRTFAKPPVFNPNAPSTSDSNGNTRN